ncbi:hypothetical protein [Anaerosporomusa subterranea]
MCCGIHFDNITKQEIADVMEIVGKMRIYVFELRTVKNIKTGG